MSSRYTPYPTHGITNAMLKLFAPSASTPPSPKNSAWIPSAMLTAMTAAHGPRTIAIMTAPTAWAVVPSGIGMLNIITRKLNAAPTAISGTYWLLTIFLTRLVARYHIGAIAAKSAPHVAGLRYPSGMCTQPPSRSLPTLCCRCNMLQPGR